MNSSRSAAEEGLFRSAERWLRSAERWAPADADIWGRWRESLRAEQRADALLPLQAVLSGLVAFRHVENHRLPAPVTDFRPHLHAAHVAYDWALQLVAQLSRDDAPRRRLQTAGDRLDEPESSLRALERSLTDARWVSERFLEHSVVDAGAFQASCDLFVRDLERNPFFEPPEPLEFSNIAELVRPDELAPELASWKGDAAEMRTLIAFLTLLRIHRFLGIADRQIARDHDLYGAHVVIAAVRRELRTVTRFLLLQRRQTVAAELERALLSLDWAVPELHPERDYGLPSDRMRDGIREVRMTIKHAAKQLRSQRHPVREPRTERKSERVPKSNHQDIWAFRFILRAFVAKASVASVGANDRSDAGGLEFVAEFVRHFRAFGPRLSRATDYPRRGPLTRAVSPLGRQKAVRAHSLDLAAHECVLFLDHLDGALAEVPQSTVAPFDKSKAAAELRGYLATARDHTAADRAAAGAFGLTDPGRVQAG
jgi:hypothetical protein